MQQVILFILAILPIALICRYIYTKDSEKEPTSLLVGLVVSGISSCLLVFIITFSWHKNIILLGVIYMMNFLQGLFLSTKRLIFFLLAPSCLIILTYQIIILLFITTPLNAVLLLIVFLLLCTFSFFFFFRC